MVEVATGLVDVVAGTTSVSEITQKGLRYRGYEVADLVRACEFEEVAYLLLYGELPNADQLQGFRQRLVSATAVPEPVVRALQQMPRDTDPMDLLRSGLSLLGNLDPDRNRSGPEVNRYKAERLVGEVAALLGVLARLLHDVPAYRVDPAASHAANLLGMMTGRRPDPDQVRVMNVSLILYAEHEFNASTFASRVIVSTLSDLYSGAVGAVGALKGPLHGGANEAAIRLLLEIGSPADAERFTRDALARKRRVMGFGHRVYKHGDHRAIILEPDAVRLCEARGLGHLNEIAAVVTRVMAEEKKLYPNLDWPAARAYYAMQLPVGLFTPIFAAARMAGWCAHMIEQLEDNRLIRPSSRYIGPGSREVPPLDRR